MAWVCTDCYQCETTGPVATSACPECGEDVVAWKGTCSECPLHEFCMEHRPERHDDEY